MTTANKTKLLERALDDGGRQIDGSVGFGTSADQRAITLAGIYIAAATAILGAVAGFDLKQEVDNAAIVAATCFYVGGVVCVVTALPITFFVGGNPPEFWRYHLKEDTHYVDALESQLQEYERKIVENSKGLRRRAYQFRIGALLGAAAPPASVFIYLLSKSPA